MSFIKALDISGSGLTAQRLRLDLISSNIANMNTTRTGEKTPGGNAIPYSRLVPVLQSKSPNAFGRILAGKLGEYGGSGYGVQVSEIVKDPAPFEENYNPEHPDAIVNPEQGLKVGFVRQSNVNLVNEMVDMMTASKAYEANVTALNSAKSLALKALEIGR